MEVSCMHACISEHMLNPCHCVHVCSLAVNGCLAAFAMCTVSLTVRDASLASICMADNMTSLSCIQCAMTSCPCVQSVGLQVRDVVVLIDREQGGEARLHSHGLQLHSAFPLSLILQVHEPSRSFDCPAHA